MGYVTDLTDQQWALIVNLLPPAKPGGRPRSTSLKSVVNAILYLLKTGCHWRLLPTDFPPWRTVYEYFARWRDTEIFHQIHRVLFLAVRRKEGRKAQPTVAIIDSQSVKTTKTGGERGYDGGKRVKGRKRHLVTDILGLPMAVVVTPANVHDKVGGKSVIRKTMDFLDYRPFKRLYADGTYNGQKFAQWLRLATAGAAKITIKPNLTKYAGQFIPVPKRWVIERSFSWIMDYRRLTVDYERLLCTSQAMLRLAAIRLMLLRLAPNLGPVSTLSLRL